MQIYRAYTNDAVPCCAQTERRLALLREEDAKKRQIFNDIKEQYDKDLEVSSFCLLALVGLGPKRGLMDLVLIFVCACGHP